MLDAARASTVIRTLWGSEPVDEQELRDQLVL